MRVDPREAKLPRWAQDELDQLRRALRDADLKAEAARLATRPDDTNTTVERRDGTIGLPNGAKVSFELPGGGIDVRVEDSHLLVMGEGFDPLMVMGQATNAIRIYQHRLEG